jgi:hypothetical protein
VNPLKSFTKLAVVIEEFMRDFKEGLRPGGAQLTTSPMTATFIGVSTVAFYPNDKEY